MSEQLELEADQDRTWWSTPRFVICAVLVGLLVVVGIILWLWPDGGGDDPAQGAAPAGPSIAMAAGGNSVCGLDATGGNTLTTPPADVEWEPLGAIYAPASEEHGPGTVDAATGVRSCYSHTPEGALLATTNVLVSGNDPQLLLDTIKTQAVDSPGKDVAVGQVQQRVSGGDASTVPLEVSGFRLLSYNDDRATVEVVVAADDGTQNLYLTTGVELVWMNGDWRVSFQDNGDPGPVSGQISDLNGYISWGPHGG